METITRAIELTVINCGCCGGSYAINERFRAKCHGEGTGWNCPYCKKSWGYFNNNENAQLKQQLAKATQLAKDAQARADHQWQERMKEIDAHHATEMRRRAEKGAKTRIKNRVAHGVCPCCKRTFQNLAQHMQNQHPKFSETD